MQRTIAAAALLLLVTPSAAPAGDRPDQLALPPADSGKPSIVPPGAPPPLNENTGCLPALPCGTRLLGTVRRNGAVELRIPALRW